ncbi:OmpH family outer membrane protein [Nevskia soli]|jgi:outer membrane protein|uniref:OmpH family outer membrane protein n=1 Tax=Nevskia soli TaxID=418856 RepID=UPI0015D7EA94|nr:OmpH family outer membrane protein [Nevskia soli]
MWAARAGLFVLVLASAVSAQAQLKVGIVDMRRAILESAEIKKISAEMEAKYKPRQDEGQRMAKQLQDIQTQIQNGQGKLSQSALTELQTQGQRRQRDLQRLSDDLQADIDRDRQDILSKAQANMQAVVKKIAEDKGYDLIVDVTSTLYYKTALDLTNDAITAYNAAHPAK